MRKGYKILAGVIMALSLAITGCGSKTETTAPKQDAAKNTAGDQKKAEPTSGKPKTLQDGKFQFALSGMYKPYNFTDADGKLTGFDTDIATEVGKRMGLEPVPVQNPFSSILQGLKAGKFDAIVGSMSITEERAKQVDFSEPYYLSQAVIFVNEKNSKGINSKEDLQGKVVGVNTSSTFKPAALKLVGPNGSIKEYESDVIGLQELKTEGRVDAVITDLGVGMNAITVSKLPAKPVGEPLFVDKVAIPVQKDNKQLLDAINKALADMKADGTYLKISQKWFNKDMLSTNK